MSVVEVIHQQGSELALGDSERIIHLHRESLGRSLIALLGDVILWRYYKFVLASRVDHLFTAKRHGEIVGVAVVSEESRSIIKRFWFANPAVFGVFVAIGFFRHGQVRQSVLGTMFGREQSAAIDPKMPELIQIFTGSSLRNQKIGTSLLEGVEKFLRQSRYKEYFIKTELSRQNEAKFFYRNRLFREHSVSSFFGKEFVFMVKAIS